MRGGRRTHRIRNIRRGPKVHIDTLHRPHVCHPLYHAYAHPRRLVHSYKPTVRASLLCCTALQRPLRETSIIIARRQQSRIYAVRAAPAMGQLDRYVRREGVRRWTLNFFVVSSASAPPSVHPLHTMNQDHTSSISRVFTLSCCVDSLSVSRNDALIKHSEREDTHTREISRRRRPIE